MRLVAAERINRMKHTDGTRYSGGSNVECRGGPSKHALAITMPEEIPRTPSVHDASMLTGTLNPLVPNTCPLGFTRLVRKLTA